MIALREKLLCYAMWRNKNGESDWQHSFGSEELTTSTYVREIVENATFDMDTTEQT